MEKWLKASGYMEEGDRCVLPLWQLNLFMDGVEKEMKARVGDI